MGGPSNEWLFHRLVGVDTRKTTLLRDSRLNPSRVSCCLEMGTKMKRSKALITVVVITAIAAITAGAFLMPAGASSNRATRHTLRFTATVQQSTNFSPNSFGQDEVDTNAAGQIIGFDVINGVFNPRTNTAKGRVAFSTRGGILYGSLRFSDGPVTHGRVTGGTGKFKGAKGTIYGRNLNASGTRTAVTVTYHK